MKNDRNLYNELLNDKKNGKIFKKDDLTEDILYKLAIEENIADSLVGDIFNISKEQVRYLRKKYNMQNKFMKRSIEHPEKFLEYIEENGFDTSIYSQKEWKNIFYTSFKEYCKSKNWNMDTFQEYLDEKREKENINDNPLCNLDLEYDVTYVEKKHNGTKNKKAKKSSGHKINQNESNKNKIASGKLGEKIVYDSEIKKLKNIGLKKLATQVEWITKTDNEDITYDGLGYDIISFNELGEKIYIEVKCSITNKTDDVIFNISQKEVDFMNGKIENIDKNHCYIYYVSNINSKLKQAKIFIISHEIFSTYKLNPTNYEINESYINE